MKEIIKNAVSLTKALVRIASESSDPVFKQVHSPEFEIAAYLRKICIDNGIPWRLQEALPGRYNFIAFFPQDNAPKLLILAHMDTVSAKEVQDPFRATEKNGKIFGRGTCDDKGPLATALSTLIGLTRENQPLDYEVTFVGTVDEECSMSGAAHFARECGEYDLCLAMEPTGLKLIHAHKGVYRGQIICKGKATHSSTPELGDNAILKMHGIIDSLDDFKQTLQETIDPDLGRASLAITTINGGSVINIIPDQCKMSFDIRLLPEHNPKEISSSLKSIIGDRGSLRKIFATRAIHSDPNDDHIKHFRQAISAQGLSDIPTTAAYATDCSKMTKKGPCIVWGPGDIAQAHQVDEFIEIRQIELGCYVLRNFLVTKPS